MAINTLIRETGETFDPEWGVMIVEGVLGKAACQIMSAEYENNGNVQKLQGSTDETRLILITDQHFVFNVTILIEPAAVFTAWGGDPLGTHTSGSLPNLQLGSKCIIPGLAVAGSILPPAKLSLKQNGWAEGSFSVHRFKSITTPTITLLGDD